MQQIPFSLFFHRPIEALCFLSLLMALCSLWIKKTIWLWGAFALISLILAFECHLLTPIAFLPLSFLAILLSSLKLPVQGFARFLLASLAFLIASGVFLHLLPGFSNSFSLIKSPLLNYGKVFTALLLLGIFIQTLEKTKITPAFLWKSFSLSLLGAILITGISFYFSRAAWHPNITLFFLPWSILTLFFTVIPEEALLRGFLQKELANSVGSKIGAQVCCVCITAAISLFFHMCWAGTTALIVPIFLSALIYSAIYQMTKQVETSIVCHFLATSAHFLLFT